MNWTREKPTQPGWYWYRSGPGDRGALQHIDAGVIHVSEWAGRMSVAIAANSDSHWVDETHGEFAGPLFPPKQVQPQAEP